MFTISTPISTPDNTSSAGFILSSLPTNYAPSVLLSNNHPVDTIIPTTPPPIVDGVIVVPAPPDVRVGVVTIEGSTYARSLYSPPPAGYFTEINGQIQIGYLGLVPPVAIGYYLAPIVIDTNYVPAPYPELLSLFPIKGDLSWTLTWEEQPTASISFITDAAERDRVIQFFSKAEIIDIYGTGFCPSGQLSITEISLTKSAIPLIEVGVSLTGWHSHLLDRYISIGKQLFAADCSAKPITALNTPDSMTVQDLAVLLGDKVSGEAIYIDSDVLTAAATTTTLGNQLSNEVVRAIGCFVDYNAADAIVLRDYDAVPTHQIQVVKSDVQTTINNKLNALGSEAGYYKTYDPLTSVSYGSATYIIPSSSAPKPTWQPKQVEYTTSTEGDPNPSLNPYTGIQKDLSIVFDISGKRKRSKKTTLANGQPIREVEVEWGYVAVAKDDAILTNDASPQVIDITGQWKVIETKTTDYTYNSYGYLISARSTGTNLVRYRTENAQKPETRSIRSETGDAAELAKLATYRFFYLATTKAETYELQPHSNYYSDVKNPQVTWSICLPDGSGKQDIQIDDQAWIPPYFVATKIVTETGFSSIPNPQSTALKPLPQLTAGKASTFIERVTVGSSTDGKDPAYYTKITDNHGASGAQFADRLSIAESQIVSGRPPTAPNLGATLEQVKNSTVTYLYQGETRTVTSPPGAKVLVEVAPTGFAIKSGLSTEDTGYVVTGTLSYRTATTATAALRAAQVDIDLTNSKNTLQESLTVPFDPTIRPGDRVIYRVNNIARSRRVISVTQKIAISGITDAGIPLVFSNGTELKLGLDVQTPVIKVALAARTTTIN